MYSRSASVMESQQKLELFISCRSLADMDTFSKSDPYVIMQVKKNNQWFEYGRTETIMDNLNPNFATSIIIDYYFEIQQHLKFIVYDYDGPNSADLIGVCETQLSAIAGAKDQVLVLELKHENKKKRGKIIIRADQVQMVNDQIKIKLSASDLTDTRFWFWHTTCPFLRFYRLRKDDSKPILVYETEHILNSREPQWKLIEVAAQKMCNGDYQMPIKIELWDWRSSGNHVYLGETQVSVNELKTMINKNLPFQNKEKKKVGSLKIQQFDLISKASFMDFIQGGLQLNLIVAIDFTASNQNPHHPSSLHYRDSQGRLNQYQQAIVSVGEILLNYDHDKKVPVYGFGCKVRMPNFTFQQTLHCFPCNGNQQDPEVANLDGIMNTYYYALQNVIFDGPTYFNPIIQESMKLAEMCKKMQNEQYLILLILTDGEIHDMKQTLNSVIAASTLPLSIIIVGVGNADFGNMEKLDNDDGSMLDDYGKKALRDLVQFVPFNEYKNNPELLAKNVLQELPDQVVDYMTLIGKKPGQHRQVSLTNFMVNDQGNLGNPMDDNLGNPMADLGNPMQQTQGPYGQQPQFQQQPPPYGQQPQYGQQPPPPYGQQPYYQQQPQQQQGGMKFKQGLAQGQFMQGFVQQANNQQYNYP